MYYGIQLAASGALTALYRTDVLTNNLANLSTAGFKPDMAFTRQRDTARVEDGLFELPSSDLLESLGAGAHMAPNVVQHAQGPIEPTGNDLDLAIDGDGFFVLRSLADGASSEVRLTRDGRFTLDSRGRIVSVASGLPLLGASGRPIEIDRALPIEIDRDGTVRQAGEAVGALMIRDLDDRSRMSRLGDGMFALSSDGLDSTRPASGGVRQGMVEGSAVNAIGAMMGVQGAAREVSTNYAMIVYQDRMMERAINTFARIG